MAEEDIEIRFRTTREGTGAEETIDDLDDVRERLDGLTTSRREQTAAAEDHARTVEEITERRRIDDETSEANYERETGRIRGQIARYGAYGVAVAGTVRAVATEVGQLLEELREVSPEAADQFKEIEELVRFIDEPISNTLGKFLSFAGGGSQEAVEGLRTAIERNIELRESFAKMILETGEAEIDALNKQADALRVASQLAAQEQQTDIALQNVSDREQIAQGAPGFAVEANRLVSDVQAEVKAIEDALQPQLADLNTAREDILRQQENLRNLIEALGQESPEVAELRTRIETAQASYADLAQAFDDAENLANASINTVLAEGVERLQTIGADAEQTLGAEASAVAEAIQSAAEAQGQELTGSARVAFETLVEITKDAVIKPEEVEAYRSALSELSASNISTLQAVKEASEEARDTLEGYGHEFAWIRSQFSAIRQQLENRR